MNTRPFPANRQSGHRGPRLRLRLWHPIAALTVACWTVVIFVAWCIVTVFERAY